MAIVLAMLYEVGRSGLPAAVLASGGIMLGVDLVVLAAIAAVLASLSVLKLLESCDRLNL